MEYTNWRRDEVNWRSERDEHEIEDEIQSEIRIETDFGIESEKLSMLNTDDASWTCRLGKFLLMTI